MDRVFQSLVYQFRRRSWYLKTYRNVASKLIDNAELIRHEDTKKLSEVFPKTFDLSMIRNGGDGRREKFVEELSTFERHFNKNMYFNYKIPQLKFHRKWNETILNGQNSWNLQDWNGDVHFGLGCFRAEDNSMYSPSFSTKVYGLHGKGEILVAKQLFLRFNDIDDMLNLDDLVLMRDPREPQKGEGKGLKEEGGLLVRRVTGLPGEIIQSASNPENQIELKPNEVWVEADKWVEDQASSEEELTEAVDSKVFGPVDCEDHVFGRVIYSIRSAVDHGPVNNLSPESQSWDQLWASDLDVEEIMELYS